MIFGWDKIPHGEWHKVTIPPSTDGMSAYAAARAYAKRRGFPCSTRFVSGDLYVLFGEGPAGPSLSPADAQPLDDVEVQRRIRNLVRVIGADRAAGDDRRFEKHLARAWEQVRDAIPCPKCGVASGVCIGSRQVRAVTLWGQCDDLWMHKSRYRDIVRILAAHGCRTP